MQTWIHPVPQGITQGFGANASYYAQFGQKGHTGIDYASFVGTPVRATNDGTVSFAGWGGNHSGLLDIAGNAILIDHGFLYSGYAHLSEISVKQGQKVKQGDIIGKTGNTGHTMGPHLHFEFLGKPTNYQNGYAGRIAPPELIQYEGDKDMPEPLSLAGARVIAHSILGYMETTRGESATAGKLDDRLIKSWVGKPLTNKLLEEAFNKDSAKDFRSQLRTVFVELDTIKDLPSLKPEDKKKIKDARDALDRVINL